jgi:hypothetical protein
MADHVRKQIRDGLVAAITGLTTTGDNVFIDPIYPIERASLPGLLVRTQLEASQSASLPAPRRYQRTVRFAVLALASLDSNVQDAVDQICKEVEIALAMPNGIAAAKTTTLLSTQFDFSGEGSQPVGRAAMVYECLYYTAENAPDTPR